MYITYVLQISRCISFIQAKICRELIVNVSMYAGIIIIIGMMTPIQVLLKLTWNKQVFPLYKRTYEQKLLWM